MHWLSWRHLWAAEKSNPKHRFHCMHVKASSCVYDSDQHNTACRWGHFGFGASNLPNWDLKHPPIIYKQFVSESTSSQSLSSEFIRKTILLQQSWGNEQLATHIPNEDKQDYTQKHFLIRAHRLELTPWHQNRQMDSILGWNIILIMALLSYSKMEILLENVYIISSI